MNRIFLYLFFIFSFDGFSQILPSQHALITTKKKSSSSPSDSWNTRDFEGFRSRVLVKRIKADLNGLKRSPSPFWTPPDPWNARGF